MLLGTSLREAGDQTVRLRRIDKGGAAAECPHASAASGVVGSANTENYT